MMGRINWGESRGPAVGKEAAPWLKASGKTPESLSMNTQEEGEGEPPRCVNTGGEVRRVVSWTGYYLAGRAARSAKTGGPREVGG